ncbi:hypothetical protein H0H92_010170 [Tricholoma furcatifolium]|nr:hypothetical protein H0H92_010170 [Tricholoma furcatifolium]
MSMTQLEPMAMTQTNMTHNSVQTLHPTYHTTGNVKISIPNSFRSGPPNSEFISKPTLPTELWLSIAQHLRYKELVQLLGLNRVFFGLVMDRRYRTFNLVEAPERFINKLEKLVRSPYIANRIRILIIGPHDTWEAMNYWPRSKLNKIDSNTRSFFPFGKLVKRDFTKISGSQILNDSISPRKPIFERRQLVINAALMLNNLAELRVVWKAKGEDSEQAHPLCPYLETLLLSFGRNLRSLSLTVPSSVASVFVPPAQTFEKLEDLSIVYHADELRSVYADKIHMVSLLPLINGTSHTLKTFSIEAYGRIGDLSTFFIGLKPFPLLSKLSIVMPLGPALIPDPSGLNRLLHHPLEDLTVRLQYVSTSMPSVPEMERWYNQCIQGVSFDTVQKLHLSHIPRMSHDLLRHIGTLKPPCERLTSLHISDIHLSHHQVTRVVTSFKDYPLQNLSLHVKDLCLQLIDLLSEILPRLNQLCLVYDVIRDFPMGHLYNQASFALMISKRPRTLEEEPFRQWDVMRSLARYIPAIQSFAGRGYMDEDEF